MVMKTPTVGMRLISSDMKRNFFLLFLTASRMDFTCVATTDSTSTGMRLNSSKQPHDPDILSPCGHACGRRGAHEPPEGE